MDEERIKAVQLVGGVPCPEEHDERELDLVRLETPPTDVQHFGIGHHALRVHEQEGFYVTWVLFDFAQCSLKAGVEVDHRYKVLAHGYGPSGSLREARHTHIGERGYVFYVMPDLLTAAFKILERWFNFDKALA